MVTFEKIKEILSQIRGDEERSRSATLFSSPTTTSRKRALQYTQKGQRFIASKDVSNLVGKPSGREHPDMAFLKRALPTHVDETNNLNSESQNLLWMETVAMEIRPDERVFRCIVVGTHDIFLVPVSSRCTSYEAFARGLLKWDSKIKCVSLYDIAKVEKTKRSPVIFLQQEMDVVSHVLTLFGKDGKVLYEFNTFEECTRLEFFLKTSWFNALIRSTTSMQLDLLSSPSAKAKEYFTCISYTIIHSKSLTEQNELLEELAFEMLRDETIKRFFFQSSAMLSTLFHWIDQFRSHVSVTLQKLNGADEGKHESAWSPNERRMAVWPLLRRLLGSVRLLFAALFHAELIRERFRLLDHDQSYSLAELSRVLSEDLSDVIKVFDTEGPPSYARRKSGNFALFVEKWEDKHLSGISFLKRQPGSRMEALDMFATVHDTQVAILVLLDQTVQQHNLECTKTAFHHGIGTNLCRYSTDLVGFLRNLVSRLITYLEAIKAEAIAAAKEEEARKEKEKRKKEVKQKKGETMLESDDDDEDDNNVDEPVDLLPRISCDNSTPRGNGQFLKTLKVLRRCTVEGITDTQRRTSTTLDLEELAQTSLPSSKLPRASVTYFGPLYTRRVSSVSDRDPIELAKRMERLKALVLLTQPHLSLYNHALLLYEMVLDDYLVREAAKEACQEEIRHYLGPLVDELAPKFANDPFHELCFYYLDEVLDLLEDDEYVVGK